MPSTQRECTECTTKFYGRTDALYCSTACRQKAYRKRNETDRAHVTTPIVTPVPPGDTWMQRRFSGPGDWGYELQATRMVEAKANATKTKSARNKDLALAAMTDDGQPAIRDYIERVSAIGVLVGDESDVDLDLDTQLDCALPASITPEVARELARTLEPALLRAHDLLQLLRGRAAE